MDIEHVPLGPGEQPLPLLQLPSLCLTRIMHLLPFQSCLLLSVVCRELRDLVQREILRGK